MSHKERVKRRRRAERVKKALARPQPAKASDYILHLTEVLKVNPDYPLLLCPRVSTPEQETEGSIEHQIFRMKWVCSQLGATNVLEQTLPWVGSAVNLRNRSVLEFINICSIKTGAIPIFESTDRLIRASTFHPHENPYVLPTVSEFDRMRNIIWVPIATILNPNTKWEEVIAYKEIFTKGQQKISDLSRPERRTHFLPTVLDLRKEGMSCEKIRKSIPNLSLSLIRFWCQKYKDENS